MTRPAAPVGYMDIDAAAELLGITPKSANNRALREGWGRKREGRRGYVYVTDDVRASERARRS